MKPMLAEDYIEAKLRFPLLAQPKIDGVRGLNMTGRLTGRSLKPHANIFTTNFYSQSMLIGMDGELAAAQETDSALCRKTTSVLSRIEGEPFTLWWLFDLITKDTETQPYYYRYRALEARLNDLHNSNWSFAQRLRLIPQVLCENLQQLNDLDEVWLDQGYEGTIIRDPNGLHKQGRSTPREGGLLRIKRFIEEEAIVNSITEGSVNGNEPSVNELGRTARSSHQENLIPNGMVGSLECTDIKTGKPITVSAGSMPHGYRKAYFENQSLLLGKKIKYKHFPKGVKDKPRFPTFQTICLDSDH